MNYTLGVVKSGMGRVKSALMGAGEIAPVGAVKLPPVRR